MGRRYLSVLLRLFFEKMLISDDILAERLLERSVECDRLGQLERRVEELERAVSAKSATEQGR